MTMTKKEWEELEARARDNPLLAHLFGGGARSKARAGCTTRRVGVREETSMHRVAESLDAVARALVAVAAALESRTAKSR